MTGGDLILLRPLWLVGIPAALFLGALAARSAHGLAAWQRITDPALLAALRARGQVTEPTRDPAPWLLAMAAALAWSLFLKAMTRLAVCVCEWVVSGRWRADTVPGC